MHDEIRTSNGNANCLTERLKGNNEHWRRKTNTENHRFDFRHRFTTGSLVVEMPEGILSDTIVCVFVKTRIMFICMHYVFNELVIGICRSLLLT